MGMGVVFIRVGDDLETGHVRPGQGHDLGLDLGHDLGLGEAALRRP